MAGTVALPHGNDPVIASNTSYWPGYSAAGSAPQGRLALNGNRPIIINSVRLYCSGYNSTRTFQVGMNGAWSGGVVMGSNSTPQSTGFMGISLVIANSAGATALTSYLSCDGRGYFHRGNGGGLFTDGNGNTWSGNLRGDYTWVESPSAPGTPALTGLGVDTLSVEWAAPTSNGGTAITGYRVQISTSSDFSSILAYADKTTARSHTFTGLTPGVTYYVRVLASNAVTVAVSTYSVASGMLTATTLSGGKRRNAANTGWDPAVVMRRNASNTGWDLATVKRRNASNTGWDAGV